MRRDDGFRIFRWAHDPYHRSPENVYHQWLEENHPDLYRSALSNSSPVTFDTLPAEAHYSRWVAEETIDFLQSGRRRERRFCFVANFFDPLFQRQRRIDAGGPDGSRVGDLPCAARPLLASVIRGDHQVWPFGGV
jgi:hypothetical protein